MEAVVEGAYGMFDYKTGGMKQIWIAGGIGLTPFLSFLRDMEDTLTQNVDFYYTVRHPEEALFVEEIEAAVLKNQSLTARIRCSSKDGSLGVKDIVQNIQGTLSEYHVYLCGPLPMVQAFERNFFELDLPKQNIHYEEFNFR
jgi:predicted ferric reductase